MEKKTGASVKIKGAETEPPSRVTMQQIAEAVGCSQATVSMALNGGSTGRRISPETSRAIQEAAEQLGYRQGPAKGGARTRSPLIIAFLVPNLNVSYWSEVLAGAGEYLASHGASILLLHEDIELQKHMRALRHADGLMFGIHPTPEVEATLKELAQEMPVVAFGAYYEQSEYDSVSTADVHGARTATEHLISQGYRRIAHIAGLPDPAPWAQHRRGGFEDALRAAGLPIEESLISVAEPTVESGYRAMTRILASGRPDALFAYNDRNAMGAIYALEDAGLRVPRDCAVMGYNDIRESRYFHVPLTTMREPKTEYGALGCYRLLELIRLRAAGGAPEPVHHQLTPQLIIRWSCGARKGSSAKNPTARERLEIEL